jgi:hypothetical protein
MTKEYGDFWAVKCVVENFQDESIKTCNMKTQR